MNKESLSALQKVNLGEKSRELKKCIYNNVEIMVYPFLNTVDQIALINKYIEKYFQPLKEGLTPFSEYNYLEAEFNLTNFILQVNTNINVEDLNENLYTDSDFLNLIFEKIENYNSFRLRLKEILDEIKSQMILKSSSGYALSKIYTKISSFLDTIKELTPEEIERLQANGMELIEKLEKYSLLGDKNK